MKREFLQNFKVGDQSFGKEIIDAILDENSRDIAAAKKPFADYETIKTQLDEAQKTIEGFKSQDIDSIKAAAEEWKVKYNQAIEAHQKQMDDLAFDGVLKDAITAAKGRNVTAIRALLDIDALKTSKNQADDINTAILDLKKDSSYLFESEQLPPPYARGAGHQTVPFDTQTAAIRSAAGLKNE